MILARGNLPFLNVGFGGPPEEVIVDGKLKVRQCTMYRSDPLPQQQLTRFELPTGQNQLPATQPSHLEWTQPPEGAQSATVQLDSNSGEVALRAGANDTVDAVTVAPIRRTGLAEIVFRVARADPGTGLVLIQDDGTPIFRVGFEWDSNGGRLTVSTQAASTGVVERAFDRNAWPVAWTANDQWLRIVAGAGTTTLWTGEDGKNWSWVGDAATRGETPPITGIGLFALKGADRGITLSHLELREFPTLNSLADPALLRRVNVESFGLPMLLDTGTWMQHVIQSQPEDIDDFTAWRQACAVATLRVGSNKTLAEALLNGLLTENLDNPGIIAGDDGHDQRFLWWMLSEASEVLDLYDTTMGLRFSHVVHESIRRRVLNSLKNQSVSVIATDEPVPDQVAQTDSPDSILPDVSITADGMSEFLMMPFWSQRVELLTPQSAAQLELLSLVQLRQDERVRQLLDRLTFWNSNSHPAQAWWTPLAASYATMAWTELAAHRSLDNEQQVARAWPSRWKTALAPIRHPLAQTVSKEAYNVMAEFQASISGRAFQDACQVISSSATSHMLGLLPDTVDDRLMVSFPNAVSLAMQEYPELRSSMNKQFGTIGRLRVRQAIKNADVDSITAATVQFFGTLAAAESAQWLGDQALAAGQFATARDHYRAALTDYRQNLAVETAEKSALKSRIRITEAILGIPLSSPQTTDAPGTTPPERPLSFGGIEMTAAQFTGLADELRTAGQAKQTAAGIHGVRSVSSAWHVSKSVFPPNGYELQQRFQIQGDAGEHAGKSAAADVNWFSRQNVTEIDGTEAYFSNRFQLTRIDLSTGQEVWRQELGANHGSVNYWPHLAMRPLLTTSRVFCRRLTKTGPHLICCDRVSGKILWTFKPESNSELLVSDPLLIRDRLQIFSQTTNATGPGLIRLLTIDVTHGTVIEDVEVLRMFADSTIPAHLCLATVDDDRIFFSVSGTIACCDSYGHSIWVRRQSWTPVIYDPLRRTRAWQPPLIHGDSVFVSQPGIDGVECLNRSSGRIQWSRMLPGLKRVVGLAGDQLLVERHSGLESLAASDGQSRWQYRATSLMDAVLATLPPDEAVILPDASQPDAVAAAAEPATQWILVTRWRKLPKNIMEARLVWLDQATGRAIAEQPLSLLNSSEVALGPFLTNGDRSWVFGAKNRKEPRQVLYELVKSETRHPTPIIDNSWSAWMPELRDTSLFPPGTYTEPHFTRTAVAPALVEAMRSICPGWILQARPQPGNTGFRPDVHGQQNVLALRLTARTLTKPQLEQAAKNPVDAIRLFRKVTIPNSPSARLRFRVGHEPKQTWKLAIRHEHCQLHSSIIDDETAPDGWQTVNVDMSSYAGST
ncbi:MAG: PQQ-binding-like beta-propeller repeat protein, partial [Planctomycetaceae bacterium]